MFKKAMSFVELVLTLSLLGLIILSAATFDYAAQLFFESSKQRAILLNEASNIIEHITQQALRGVGSLSSPALVDCLGCGTNNEDILQIRQDTDGFASTGFEQTVGYAQDLAAAPHSEIVFCSDANCAANREIFTRRAILPADGIGFDANIIEANIVRIAITLRYHPERVEHRYTNRQITVSTVIRVPAASFR